MSGGGKGGSQTTSVQIPEWLQGEAQRNIARANKLAQIGYTPYYGPDVAALTPMQMAAMQGTNTAASAFGLPTADINAGMPQATNYNGMMAYSSAPLYEQSLQALQENMPGQYNALRSPFIDPVTGARPKAPFGSFTPSVSQPTSAMQSFVGGGGGSDGGGNSFAGNAGGGYTSFRDMFDGGGPGQSGDRFQGGGMVSAVGNALGGPRSRDANDSGGSSGAGGGK